MNPFLINSCLTPKVSINRMKFVSLGGLKVDEGLAGKTGLELVSAETFTEHIDNFLRDQNFDTLEDDNLNLFLECLGVNQKAEIIVRRFARNLAHLLLALKRGDSENRRARDDWGDAEWDFWNGTKKIILCGGLTQGVLGDRIKRYILEFFEESGMRDAYEIKIPPNSRSLPIVGACRLLGDINNGEAKGLAFDFGHSYVKRCLADFTGGICRIQMLNKMKSKFMQLPPDYDLETAKALHGFIVEAISDAYSGVLETNPEIRLGDRIVLSIANYIRNGVPDPSRGGYAKLSLLCVNYEEYLARELRGRLGVNFKVSIIHDGMSAAYALDCREQGDTVVISLGTGLGVGFPPENERTKFDYLIS